jgi:hypothetical protein
VKGVEGFMRVFLENFLMGSIGFSFSEKETLFSAFKPFWFYVYNDAK